ncbi:MAG: Shedu anti-phage system protein SduA domain-containing protein [Candidatus Moraniibacteriota bacterium]
MNSIITTKSIGKGIAEIEEDFILCEEPMSRLVFRAQIHNGGIRGKIIRQRRESNNDSWISDKAIDIRTLGKNESINIDVSTEAVKNLYLATLKLANILKQQGVKYGENKYAVVDPDLVIITDENKIAYIKKIIEAGYDEEVWNNLAESNPSLVTKLSYARIQESRQKVVEEFKLRLQDGKFSETSGSDSWQKWIYKNNWLFGANYKEPIEKTKINIAGAMPDYLFPTLDGFTDILEIKLPHDEVILKDNGHIGSWRWTSETNIAIGQVVNYLGEIDRMRLEIEKNVKTQYGYEICLLKPRAYILIGDNSTWSVDKKEGLRKMNHVLHGIEILTYKDLLDRGNQAINTKL